MVTLLKTVIVTNCKTRDGNIRIKNYVGDITLILGYVFRKKGYHSNLKNNISILSILGISRFLKFKRRLKKSKNLIYIGKCS